MAENESIGGVRVDIVGDYSKLQTDLSQAQKISQDAGEDIAKAFNAGVSSADQLSQAILALVGASGHVADQMGSVADSIKKFQESAENANKPTEGFGSSVKGLVGEVAGLLAALGGTAALVAFGKEALEAADAVDDAARAMTMLGGSAEETEKTIAELRDLADDAALGFPDLLQAANRMTAFLGTTEPVPDILRAIADSAAIMGTSIEASAGGFERLVASGELSQGSLRKLGLTMDEVAQTMGVSADQVKDAFRAMDESGRVEVMIAALGKFKGAAKDMADDSVGSAQRLKNSFFDLLSIIGKELEPVINGLSKAVGAVLESLQRMAISVAGVIKTVAQGLKAVWSAVTFDNDGFVKNMDAMVGEWNKAQAQIRSLDDAKNKANVTTAESNRLTEEEIKTQARAALARANATKAAKDQADIIGALTKSTKEFTAALPESYEQYANKLSEGGKKAQAVLSGTEDAITKASVAMEGLKGKPLAAMQAIVDKLTVVRDRAKAFAAEDLWNKQAQDIAALADKYQQHLAGMDESTLDWINAAKLAAREVPDALNKATDVQFLKAFLETMDQMSKELSKLDAEWNKLASSGAKATAKFTEEMMKPIPIVADLRTRVGEAMAAYMDMVSAMNKVGFKTVEQMEAAIQLNRDLFTEMERLNQPIGHRLEMQGRILKGEIAIKEAAGESATSQIIGLKNVQLQQEMLYDQTHMLGDLYAGVLDAMMDGWFAVGDAIGDALFDGNNFGDSMLNIIKSVARSIFDDLVNTALKALRNSFLGVGKSIQDVTKDWEKLSKAIKDAVGAAKSVPGGGVGGKGSGIGGGLGMAGDIASIASAISSIFGNFQMAAMNKSLDILVNHTLRIFNVLDQWYTASQDWFGQVFTRLGEIWRDMNLGFEAVVASLGGGKMSTLPLPLPPGIPPATPPASGQSMSSPSAGVYANASTSSSSNIGGISFTVVESSSPRETAREIASTLKQVSGRFAAYAR